MYVQWLLEFIWRIFIQGPLLIINFFTKDNVISKITSNIGFNIDNDLGIINALINTSIIFLFVSIIMLAVFVVKICKVIITSNHYYTKEQLIHVLKEFGKTILISLMFIVVFELIFSLFDIFIEALNQVYDKNLKASGKHGHSYDIINLPEILYKIISGEEKVSPNFLFPKEAFLTKMDNINFLSAIILVFAFAFFLIWMVWSIYQKFLEIIFLYVSFPVSLAFGEEKETISWKIWTKEIFNKMVIIFLLMVCLRLYCYFFLIVESGFSKIWKTNDAKLYLSLILILAEGFSVMFYVKFISTRNKENIGIWSTINSFKQTRNFIRKTNKNINHINKVQKTKVNDNIEGLKTEVRRLNSLQRDNYNSLRKVKIFNK